MQGKQVVDEIEALVTKYGAGRYGRWMIGAALNTEALDGSWHGPFAHCWEVEGHMTAANISRYFVGKGMVPDTPMRQSLNDSCVYVR